jgi:hypothetical protein
MQRIKLILKRAVLYTMAVMLAGGSPMMVFADDGAQSDETYTQNADGKHWDSSKWIWDAATHRYVPAVPKPAPSPAATSDTTATTDSASATTNAGADPGSDANVTVNTNGAANTNDTNNTTIENGLNSDAGTGNAGVRRNLTAGGATTGDASATTTIVNSVHSTVGGSSDTSGIAHFTTNLYGDITGDITIGPSIDNATIDKNTNLSSNTNVNNNNSLTNNQTLKATSGNADVTANTTGGSAQSGNANTVADVLNLINTIVAANKSFVGTINIYGNLNGDIMVSPDFIPQLLASNSGAEVVGNYNMPLSMTTNDDQSIVNNVKLNATTGTATVKDNTSAGSAQTGTATTNLTILNLTGHKVDAAKSLLVFVNVLGKWVGMIVDAPGATSAALGSGVTHDDTTISSTNTLNNNAKITNNIDLTSASGDATVAKNTKGGDAITGNATASANIANISTSEFNLSDWFGVLFINVFGTWVGSFGIDTAAGTVTPLTGDAIPRAPGAPNLQFGFRPATPTVASAAIAGGSGDDDDAAYSAAATMASLMQNGGTMPAPLVALPSPHEDQFSVIMMIAGFTVAGASAVLWLFRRWLTPTALMGDNAITTTTA